MPLAIFALTIAAYAIGTTEFVIVGLLPTVAADLGITLPLAGLIVSVYALGVTFGAPVLTALTGRIGRKPLLLGLMALFIAGNTAAALSPNYEMLLAARVLSAFAHGVFFSVGSTIAADLVPENRRASAIAMMFMGLTVAIVTGVPIGTHIGQIFGWRTTFWAVAALGVIAFIGIAALLPKRLSKATPARLADQLRVLSSGRLLIVFAMTALGYGGTFVAFTYLAPILEQITGFSAESVSLILVLYGIAIAVGNLAGGRIANANPVKALAGLFLLQALVLFTFSFTAASPVPTLATLAALGFLSFANVPGLQLYVVQLAKEHRPRAVDVASALNIAAFNLGIALGAWLGGRVVDSALGLGATPWVGAVLVSFALLLTLWSGALDRRSTAALQGA
ncbi:MULTISPECIES: MFS transporter [Sinorhizobium]|uniref:MFS sugar transporter n=2 Tax=Sinorhizobium TaxID=28105 RepID=A0A2S3YVA9_9HYPH|nr:MULTISPECIES: MFS transporter [Sinorhizobium]ASY60533.1 Major facilitator family transporter [Sinorhizobium sp. CCBAU 05631]AUX80711.1 major facilitator superfamily protein [Sinorhizobium fredii]PDT39620.1 MFS transporter [Sinorhizobium sp. FG01]PDT51309.1 MFS transporter [Sinorhizobium sp. NG07B]POH25961.1 MFS sugar transporter [Sinorhizobium americanum]